MKKTILLAAAFSLVAVGTAQALDSTDGSNGVLAGAGITGTKHDLSATGGLDIYYPSANSQDGTQDPLDRICIWCHAPHHTMVSAEAGGIDYLPLWNHEITIASYTPYESDFGGGPLASGLAGVGVAGSGDQFADRHLLNADLTPGPGGVSRLCLSCHDGTVAVNNYGRDKQRDYSQSGRDGSGAKIRAQFEIGANPYGLLNHHPIGFSYLDVAALDDEIADPDKVVVGGGSTEVTTIRSLLYGAGGMMECVTCHDVHNSKNSGETFLWVTDRQSVFCLTCHEK